MGILMGILMGIWLEFLMMDSMDSMTVSCLSRSLALIAFALFLVKLRWKCKTNLGKDGVGKMKTKTYFVVFSNACSILELMLCNRNLTKLVYQTLLSSDCRAWALKLGEHLKKQQKISIKIMLIRSLIRQLKKTINQCKTSYMRKNHFFCKNVFLYTINNISMVLKIIIS